VLGTVAAHASWNVPVADTGKRADDVLAALQGRTYDTVAEHQLEEQVLLAFFVPGVVYLADAVGTQTEALVIRGLSVGVGIGRLVWREAATGVLLGVLFAAVSYPAVVLLWGAPDVAAAVAIASFAASSVATLIAMLMPWTLHRLGRDPAFGSGPLATVIQDLLSIVIYFLAATALVH